METQQSRQIVTALAHRVDTGANARQIADAIVSTWQEIDAALSPILGRQGVGLLYQRSVALAARTHPWLAGICENAHALVPDALRAAFSRQTAATAAAAARDLLQAFHEMLASLVGPPLAGRLLRFLLAPDEPQLPELAAVETSGMRS